MFCVENLVAMMASCSIEAHPNPYWRGAVWWHAWNVARTPEHWDIQDSCRIWW